MDRQTATEELKERSKRYFFVTELALSSFSSILQNSNFERKQATKKKILS